MAHNYKDDLASLLPALETELEGNTFLNERINLGVPDLLIFALLYRYFLDLDNNEKKEIPSLYRWINYV